MLGIKEDYPRFDEFSSLRIGASKTSESALLKCSCVLNIQDPERKSVEVLAHPIQTPLGCNVVIGAALPRSVGASYSNTIAM